MACVIFRLRFFLVLFSLSLSILFCLFSSISSFFLISCWTLENGINRNHFDFMLVLFFHLFFSTRCFTFTWTYYTFWDRFGMYVDMSVSACFHVKWKKTRSTENQQMLWLQAKKKGTKNMKRRPMKWFTTTRKSRSRSKGNCNFWWNIF